MRLPACLNAAVFAAACGLAVAAAAPAEAAFTFTVQQNGPDVEVDGSGSLQLSGLSFVGSDNDTLNEISPNIGFLTRLDGPFDIYGGLSGPAAFGPGAGAQTTVGGGDTIGVNAGNGRLVVPAGYVSGTLLAATMIFENQTFATLGLTPGTYVYSWGGQTFGDSITIEVVGPTGVPEPATALLLGAGLVGLAGARRRRAAG
ncbi:PEP-CTERM sorting domain-containing protein [Roseomonas sp. AR75]|uniref:PEP-CTERM sorting domain-containing protein n=1 Tax=Roseomonas sp. AR75 TaxID=2562311 RepID=UPI0019808B34|nr:PEP-CTERM sorting domain-containing protein [Roseomonas sp. AR75]